MYILPNYLHVVVPIVGALHVVEAQGMEHFVYYSAVPEAAFGQVQNLVGVLSLFLAVVREADVRETTVLCTLQV